MKILQQHKAKFLVLIFLAISLAAYSGPGAKSNSAKKEYKPEHKSMKGACHSYKQNNCMKCNNSKKFQKKISRAKR